MIKNCNVMLCLWDLEDLDHPPWPTLGCLSGIARSSQSLAQTWTPSSHWFLPMQFRVQEPKVPYIPCLMPVCEPRADLQTKIPAPTPSLRDAKRDPRGPKAGPLSPKTREAMSCPVGCGALQQTRCPVFPSGKNCLPGHQVWGG